ncbi:hypothetical protein GLYMA_10G014100v4 [Glycine max]|uniref:BRCT domain-containing protein n=1 Tax=Glycine max TaxID=3847 RepID=A0A0R0HW95_SOYBN|nr:hypothetical protein GYH30_026635 [Glycine max]KRH31813.1 hypothetical protein GLYMA_10G014100v4 [Glycine max]
MMEATYPSPMFRGVRFVLRGFNPVAQNQIRFKLANGGGVDVGQYGGSCTHVIVDNVAYDDPVCVAARNDRKTVVTALWVEHSADIGMPVDATSQVMYRPLKDLDGIPGAKDLIMCLTGYLRQDRDDIMTMVGLMGAQFSKPLVANKVTHLICYKFEGEKYELAKKLGTIKLVNHRWLEDCLKEWVLLPEDKYNKSGFELEMMEEEAKDSEQEAEDSKLGQSGGRKRKQSPLSSKIGIAATPGLSKSATEASNALPDSTGPQVLPNVNNGENSLTVPGNKSRPDQGSSFHNVDDSKVSYQAADISRHSTSCQLPNKYVKTSESKNADSPKAPGCQDLGNMGNTNSSDQQPDLNGDISESKKVASDLRETSASAAGVAHSNEKLRTASYSRKNQKGFTLPRILDESSGREGNNCDNSKVQKASEGVKSTSVEVSGKGNDFVKDEPISLLPQKRINKASFTKLKSRKKTSVPSANGKSQGLKVTSQVDEPPEADDYFSIGKDGINNSNTCLVSKPSGSTSNSLAFDELLSRNASPESVQCDNVCQNSSKMAVQSLSESKINGKPDITGSGMQQVGGNEVEQHTVTKNLDCSSLGNKKSCNVESAGCTKLDLGTEESNKLVSKSPRKKSVAKRSLGSKPKVGATAKQKKSLSLTKTTLQGEGETFSSGSKEVATGDARMHQGCPQIFDVNKTTEQETVSKNAGDRTEFLDDETEAPDDKCEYELGMALDEDLVHLSKKPDTAKEEKSEATYPATKCEEAMPPKNGTNKTEKQKTSSLAVKHQARKLPAGKVKATVSKYAEDDGDRTELVGDETEAPDGKCEPELRMALDEESHLSKKSDTATEEKSEVICPETKCEEPMPPKKGTKKTEKQKPSSLVVKNQARKRPAGKTKAKVAKELPKSMAVYGEKIPNETEHEPEIETMEEMPLPDDKSDQPAIQRNKSENFAEEKENRPIDGEQGKSNGSSTIKSSVRTAKIKSKKSGLNPSITESNTRVKTEAACFILSGHRLQRKEFQQVIKRLKGRVCRDSHQWSYQATHFIAPDPIRRTEKFFAAAASGRWILKTDFLTASSQAGKLLAEEPYEWHQNGFSEDGTINMEAPRKWRLLKERTGHGAFYGMRIVVYGDCIAPPLDTLKRVIKAGDGTILATSPPYTRFLSTGIDYAVVSPGMPRVDMWVQEFLKHEIPCVVADYLVEYVCKPGFSLERHVLYGTHAWAERSFDKLKSKAEEIVEELVAPEDSGDDHDHDIICKVCGSRDRGDVMLICGDESGSVGCGIGTHIDCCDPPLTHVPEEDWFCPKCSSNRNCSNNPSKRKKTVLSSSVYVR